MKIVNRIRNVGTSRLLRSRPASYGIGVMDWGRSTCCRDVPFRNIKEDHL